MSGWLKGKMAISVVGMAITVVAFVAGCGSSGAGSNTTGGSSGSNSGQATVTSTGDAAQGAKLFAQNCSSCHSTGTNRVVGPGLQGIMNKQVLPNGKSVSEANVADWIRTGGGGMPGFPQLSDQQRADIVAYLKTLS